MTQGKWSSWTLSGIATVSVVGLVVSLVALSRARDAQTQPDGLTRDELVALHKMVQANLRIENDQLGEPSLYLYDSDGVLRVALGVDGLCFYNSSGAPVLRSSVSPSYVGVSLGNPTDDGTQSDKPMLRFGVDDAGTASVELVPGGGFAYLSAGVDGKSEIVAGSGSNSKRAQVRLHANGSGGAGIRIRNTATAEDWRAPR